MAVIDDRPQPGGQIDRQPSPLFEPGDALPKRQYGELLSSLAREFMERPIRYMPDTTVWGVFEDRLVATDNPQHPIIAPERLLIANGAYETPLPFPGWTLPGVMTVGGLQNLLKTQTLVPTGKVFLSGTGPFLYLAADQLAGRGVQITAVADLASRSEWLQWAVRLVRLPSVLREGMGYFIRLYGRRIPVLFRHTVVRALGEDGLRSVVVAATDRDGRPLPGSERELPADILAVNVGFSPSTDLTRMAGCSHHIDPIALNWRPDLDLEHQSSQPGIYAAGDCAGIGFLPQNILEGELVGTEVAYRLGLLAKGEARQRIASIQRKLASYAWYSDLLAEIYAFRPGLLDLMSGATVVCRCEGVSRGAVESSFAPQISIVLDAIKRLSRAGMGQCQGKLCFPTILRMLSGEIPADQLMSQDYRSRPPLKPISMRVLAGLAEAVRSQTRSRPS